MKTNRPDQYSHLTPGDLLRLYDGPGALECPPELVDWLDTARKLEDVRALGAENDRRERNLVLRDLLGIGRGAS